MDAPQLTLNNSTGAPRASGAFTALPSSVGSRLTDEEMCAASALRVQASYITIGPLGFCYV